MAERKNWFLRVVRWEPGISLGQWIYDRIANNWDRLVALFVGAGGMSYLASITEWLKAWGPVGIGAVGIGSALIIWIGLAWAQSIRAQARRRHAETYAIQKWEENVDDFNPLSPEFHLKRMKIGDLANPISKKVIGKCLIDCELIGPAVIFFHKDIEMNGVGFVDCDVVVAKPVETIVLKNVVGFEKFKMIGGTIWNCTIIIQPHFVKTFAAMGVDFVTLTGEVEIDSRLPPMPAK